MVQVQHFLLKLSFSCQWQSYLPKRVEKAREKKQNTPADLRKFSLGSAGHKPLIGFWVGSSKNILFGFTKWAYRREEWQWTSTLWESGVHWDFANSLKPWKFMPEKDLSHRLSEWYQCSGSASLGRQCLGSFSGSGELGWHPEHTSVVRYCPDQWPALWTGHHFKLLRPGNCGQSTFQGPCVQLWKHLRNWAQVNKWGGPKIPATSHHFTGWADHLHS